MFSPSILLFVQTCNFSHNQTTSERLGKKKSSKSSQKGFDSGTTSESDDNGALLRDASVDSSIKQSSCFLVNCMRMIRGSQIIDQDQLFLNCTTRTNQIKGSRN